MFHFLAAFAEHESDRIQIRIKEEIAVANRMKPILLNLHEAGNKTIRSKVAELNRQSIPSYRGGKWHLNSLHQILQRIERLD